MCNGSKDYEELSQRNQPEFRITSDPNDEEYEIADEAFDTYKSTGHRKSFSDLLTQSIKRVNSVNNLNIPTIVSSLTQNSKSLPPTPMKQSISQNERMNPFPTIISFLEKIPIEKDEISCDQISVLVEPLMSWESLESMTDLAKSSSQDLYNVLDAEERFDEINKLVRCEKLSEPGN